MENQYWDARYESGGHSGYGSYGEQLNKKLGWIRRTLSEVNSISELGCGDFNFGKRVMELFPKAAYYGTDTSKVIVEKNQKLFPFANFSDAPDLPKADLVMCVDVLFHVLEESNVEKVFEKLDNAWTKYLILTAYERDSDEKLSPHVVVRKFDPRRFGEPIFREVVEEEGSLYFYVFKR